MNSGIIAVTLVVLVSGISALPAAERVTVENFARAETDTYNRGQLRAADLGVGELAHFREPVNADNQTVIRQNQDTLYSGTVIDLSKPASISMPETAGRYMSMHVINQDHYMFVESEPGTYELTQESVGTPGSLFPLPAPLGSLAVVGPRSAAQAPKRRTGRRMRSRAMPAVVQGRGLCRTSTYT